VTRAHLAAAVAAFVVLPVAALAQAPAAGPAAAPPAPVVTQAPATPPAAGQTAQPPAASPAGSQTASTPDQGAGAPAQTPVVPPAAGSGSPATPSQIPPDAQIPIGTRISLNPSGYDDGGRRDPFVSLIVEKKAPTGPPVATTRALTGLASLAVSDVTVKGIVHVGSKYMVTLEGPNHKSYTASPQDRLADGLVKAVDADGVVFEVQVTDAGGAVHARDVRKMLHPAAEDIR
jgi:hypothetical protein